LAWTSFNLNNGLIFGFGQTSMIANDNNLAPPENVAHFKSGQK